MACQWAIAGLAGVALGRFSWTPEDVQPGDLSMEEVLLDRLGDLGIPLVLDLPVGHGQPNAALPMGRTARLDGGPARSACSDQGPVSIGQRAGCIWARRLS
ncbi:hypothetical protein AAF143_12155 [Cyanobium sp. ATX-6F1]